MGRKQYNVCKILIQLIYLKRGTKAVTSCPRLEKYSMQICRPFTENFLPIVCLRVYKKTYKNATF